MNPDETRISEFLSARGLTATLFTSEERQAGKTPDFRVFTGNSLAFFCEVKSVIAGEIGGCQKDPTFNRLTNDLHTAAKQFDAVNPDAEVPNVLALVNHDRLCGFLDLIAVLTGNFIAEDGENHPIYRKFSEGRIKDEKARIHMVIWLDDFKPERVLFTRTNAGLHEKLCAFMRMNPGEIERVDA